MNMMKRLAGLAVLGAVALVAGCGTATAPAHASQMPSAMNMPAGSATTNTQTPLPATAPAATVTMPGDYFTPAVIQINAGQSVLFRNTDTDVHSVVALPGSPQEISLSLKAGEEKSVTLTKPGIYEYYCSVHAMYDAKDQMVKALKEADMYPAAMKGVIYVASAAAPASLSASVAMPGDSFMPGVTVVRAGGTVTWDNQDTDVHSVVTTPGTPEKLALTAKAGEKVSYTFQKPGIYPYYCTVHATYDSKDGMVKALKEADMYPGAMEGVVIVTQP